MQDIDNKLGEAVMNEYKQKSKIINLSFLFFLLLLLILGACNSPAYPVTWMPSPSSTPTCIPNLGLLTPVKWGQTQLVVVLYDPRPEVVGSGYLELVNKEKTQDVDVFVQSFMSRLVRPGWEIAAFQLGYASYEGARVGRIRSYASPPKLYNTPAPPQTLTPLPTPVVTLTPGFGYIATKRAEDKVATARSVMATSTSMAYDCANKYWNDSVKLTATAWSGTATADVRESSQDLATEVARHDNGVNVKETPFKTDELYYGGVYNGLGFATRVFKSDCKDHKDYNRCSLVIVDDMSVWGKHNPENIPIDLTGVKVYVVMPNCLDLDQPSCVSAIEYWQAELQNYGVKSNEIQFLNGERAESKLLDLLGGKNG